MRVTSQLRWLTSVSGPNRTDDGDRESLIKTLDFTAVEGERMVNILYGTEAPEILKHRWQIVK